MFNYILYFCSFFSLFRLMFSICILIKFNFIHASRVFELLNYFFNFSTFSILGIHVCIHLISFIYSNCCWNAYVNETYTSPRTRGDHQSPRYSELCTTSSLSSYFLQRSINLQWRTKKLPQEPDDCTGTSPTVIIDAWKSSECIWTSATVEIKQRTWKRRH